MRSAVLKEHGGGQSIAGGSVVIPAHNEAAVIARLLGALPDNVGSGHLQVVVACNGCVDNTAQIAREHGATVVEVSASSKIAALNAGDLVAAAFPRMYIDADVVVSVKTITDLVQAFSDSRVLCAAPPFRVEAAGRPWTVRAYFAVWSCIPYLKDGYVGSGIYAVSKAGRARFDSFPPIVADDFFIRNLYARGERRVVPTEPFVIQAPWTLRALLRRRVRIDIGNIELGKHSELNQALPGLAEVSKPWWRGIIHKPLLYPAATIYAAVNQVAKILAHRQIRRRGPIDWGRDDTTRSGVGGSIGGDASVRESK